MYIETISRVLEDANVPHVHVTAFDDRQTQERLRDELVDIAKNAGFEDTKAFIIDISKTSTNVYAVAIYLKPYYSVSETSYKIVVREQRGVLTEYNPDTISSLGLRAKLGQFKKSKFAAVVRGLFTRSESNRPNQ